jgi:putative membrane protein
MKKQTFAAVATLATTMFVSQGATAQDQPDASAGQAGRADQKSQQDQAGSPAQQAGDQAGQAGARAGQAGRAGQQQNMDQKFVEFASTNDQFEIQAARLAEQRAQDENVKRMAQEIMQDHQQSSQRLQQAAQQASLQVSQQLKPHQQAMLQELQQMQGMEFDREWLYGQVAGHTKAVLKFRDAAKECQNPQIKQFAQQTLPKLQQHLQHAQEIAQFDTATTAGATERGSGRRPASERGSDTGTDTSGTDTSGTDPTNRRGAGTNDTGSGSSTDSGSSGRSPSR